MFFSLYTAFVRKLLSHNKHNRLCPFTHGLTVNNRLCYVVFVDLRCSTLLLEDLVISKLLCRENDMVYSSYVVTKPFLLMQICTVVRTVPHYKGTGHKEDSGGKYMKNQLILFMYLGKTIIFYFFLSPSK